MKFVREFDYLSSRVIYLQLQSEMPNDLTDMIYIIYVTSEIMFNKLSSLQDHALTIGTIALYYIFTVLRMYYTAPCIYCTVLYCTVLYYVCTALYYRCTALYYAYKYAVRYYGCTVLWPIVQYIRSTE